MKEARRDRSPLLPRRDVVFASLFAGLKLAFSGEPAHAELQKPDEKPVPVERWTSELRQTLASLIRPGAPEHENVALQLLDLLYPFLISNSASVAYQAGELLIKCYVAGPKSGDDLGDGIQTNEKQRIYEIFMASNLNQPNMSSATIRTSQKELPTSDAPRSDFVPQEYPFDFEVSIYTFGITVVHGNEQLLPEDSGMMFETMYLDLFEGEIIAPPLQQREKPKESVT